MEVEGEESFGDEPVEDAEGADKSGSKEPSDQTDPALPGEEQEKPQEEGDTPPSNPTPPPVSAVGTGKSSMTAARKG